MRSQNSLKYEVEECINNQVKDVKSLFHTQGALHEVLKKLLLERGYSFKNNKNSVNPAAFYKRARITKQTWSDMMVDSIDGLYKYPSKETMLKIVVALRLSVDEANELMRLASHTFNPNDLRDRVIMACLEIGQTYSEATEPETVYDVLEFFSECEDGKRRFRNIYEERYREDDE